MQNATAIFAVMQERGKKGQTVERLYRMLFNRDLYLQAYAKLYSNKGAMTPGSTDETVDGMSIEKIDNIIEAIKNERYQWTPVRRIYIPKSNGKKRPLGLLTWSDKLVQEVIRSILEPYYEPQFSEHSHGFRPNRGCHTALKQIQRNWTGVKWIVEGDISSYFDSIDHTVLLEILREKIDDNRFIRLIEGLLKAGYLEDWKYNKTYSGTPQGGVLSPLLSNIYLDRLDKYIGMAIKEFDKGLRKAPNPEYARLVQARHNAKKKGYHDESKKMKKLMMQLPSNDPNDPNFRRLKYVRYADDFMLGVIGPKSEAEEIKRKIGAFLKDNLKLELSEKKTLITHAIQESARFLGYEIKVQMCNTKVSHSAAHPKQRNINGTIALLLPDDVIQKKSQEYMQNGKPEALKYLTVNEDFSIVNEYQSKLRGLYQYYAYATNVSKINHLKWIMQQSLVKTLATKNRCSSPKIYEKYGIKGTTDEGKELKFIQVVVERDGKKPLKANFGGFSLKRKAAWKEIDDLLPKPMNSLKSHTEILQRLLANQCEVCGSIDKIEVHHVRKLSDVEGPKNGRTDWKRYMASRRRKTLVLCQKCHDLIHAGKPLPVLNK